jgi:hypothetical protein
LFSLTLKPFTNIQLLLEVPFEDSQEFYKIRSSILTPKYYLHDIGIELILLSIMLFIFFKMQQRSPKNRSTFIFLSLFLPFVSVVAYIFDLLQGANRFEYPPWADTLAIPLSGAPFIFVVLLIWSLLHLLFLKNLLVRPLKLNFNNLKQINLWLIIVSLMTLLLTISSLLNGEYWYGLAGLMWIYFYLSLGVVKSIAEKKKI